MMKIHVDESEREENVDVNNRLGLLRPRNVGEASIHSSARIRCTLLLKHRRNEREQPFFFCVSAHREDVYTIPCLQANKHFTIYLLEFRKGCC